MYRLRSKVHEYEAFGTVNPLQSELQAISASMAERGMVSIKYSEFSKHLPIIILAKKKCIHSQLQISRNWKQSDSSTLSDSKVFRTRCYNFLLVSSHFFPFSILRSVYVIPKRLKLLFYVLLSQFIWNREGQFLIHRP